jgi:hypothetical protein
MRLGVTSLVHTVAEWSCLLLGSRQLVLVLSLLRQLFDPTFGTIGIQGRYVSDWRPSGVTSDNDPSSSNCEAGSKGEQPHGATRNLDSLFQHQYAPHHESRADNMISRACPSGNCSSDPVASDPPSQSNGVPIYQEDKRMGLLVFQVAIR